MSQSFRLRRERLEWTAVDQEVVALDIDAERYLGINPSGRLLWEALLRGASLAELTDLLVSRYRLEVSRAQHDVEQFLAELDRRGLLER